MNLQTCLLLAVFACASAELTLERVGRVQLPIEITDDGTELLCWNVDLAEEVVYDSANLIAYVGGEEVLTVIDIEDPTAPAVLDRVDFGVPIADVQICGDIIAVVAYSDVSDALDGKLFVFSPYDAATNSVTQTNEFTICSEPDHLIFTPDCGKILVACSGKPGLDADGAYINPEGAVAIIDTTDIATAGQEAVTIVDFTKFNADPSIPVAAGVRYIYRGQASPEGAEPDTFSKDMEPEYVATSLDGTIGYVVLQTNNALAYLDIEAGEITDIKGFGYKAWGEDGFTLDASDQDDGINMMPWNIRGLYTPDIVDVFEHEGVEYIVTANEGDAKELFPDENGVTEEWTEEIAGVDLVDVVSDMELKMALNDTAQLGRLAFSNVDGAPTGGADKNLYTYGGRSVTIWRADDLTLVWDSADIIESIHASTYPEIFNMDPPDEFCPLPSTYPQYGTTQAEIVAAIRAEIDANTTDPDYELPGDFEALINGPSSVVDKRSDNKGPEPESVVVGMVGDKRVLFVGNERTSTIFMFDITDPVSPTLEGTSFDGAVDGAFWDQLVDGTLAPIDPEGLIFIPKDDFAGLDEDIVMVASAVSGALYLYKVVES